MPKYTKSKKSKKQNTYRMKGCSKKTRKNITYLGGSSDVPLSYPSSNVPTIPNPDLAYNPNPNQFVKSYANNTLVKPIEPDIARAYPTKGPVASGFNFLNPQIGAGRHRKGCLCSVCKSKKGVMTGGCGCSNASPIMSGGGSCSTSNNGIPYPDGLLGDAWTPNVKGWPGIDGISMNRNHLGYNTYSTDVSRQMIDLGANPPFTYMKGGRTKKRRKQQPVKQKKLKVKGGSTASNLLGQDLINVGRQFQFNVGSAWNGLKGYEQPVNPLPWKDQLTGK